MVLVQASDLIALFRLEGNAENAWKLGFQTDTSADESRAFETTITKDRKVKTPGEYDATHSITSLLAKNDTQIKQMKEQVRAKQPKRLEVWLIDRSDISDEDTTTIPGDYSIDVITNVSPSAGSEGNVEYTIKTEVEEGVVSGDVTVTPELRAILLDIANELEFVQPMATEE